MTASFDFVAPHMRSLQKLDQALSRLDVRWEVIETTTRIVCPREAASFLPTLMSTRSSFSQLAGELVERIAAAHLDNRLRELSSRAQVAIDILVRNLFERTADVGFIATDSPLVEFVQSPDAAGARALEQRLAEYRAKYTVYSDIVVLSADARVLVRLAPGDAQWEAPPSWWDAMSARDGHVERFERCAVFGGEQTAHYYAHRIVGAAGSTVGAVLLRFDFESELASVFEDLIGTERDTVIVFTDDQRRIIASSRPHMIALGSHLGCIDDMQVLAAGGQEWLAQERWTRGYQGYKGLPWQAVAMIRVDAAFRLRTGAAVTIDATLQDEDPRLREIVEQARRVEEGLHRVVWNGKLARTDDAGASSVHAAFDQIAGAGRQTTALFTEAIGALKALLREGRCAELAFHASLAVRIMDRNLYERANDCRWWALSPDLAEPLAALATDPADTAAQQGAERVLAHLNSLYTVYRRVALFDRTGRVVAVSRDAQTLPPGLTLDPQTVQRVLGLSGTAAYIVSKFEPSALTDGLPTYLYLAAVRNAGGEAIGGVALAFNSDVEFLAMLKDSLPDGETLRALLVDPHGTVISSTDDTLPAGQPVPLPFGAAPMSGGCAWAQLIHRDGEALLAGVAVSQGYREFKRGDGYVEPVRAVLLNRLPVEATAPLPRHADLAATSRHGERRIAVVACGSLLLGFDAASVVEAVSAQRMVRVAPGGIGAGLLEYVSGDQKSFVTAIDMGAMCGEAPADSQRGVAVIVHRNQSTVALLVDRLVHVIERSDVQLPPQAVAMHSVWINGVLGVGHPSNEMIYLVDTERLLPAYRTTGAHAWTETTALVVDAEAPIDY